MVAVGVATLMGANACGPRQSTPTPSATSVLSQRETPLPGLAATVTAVRSLPDLPAEQARPYDEISQLVSACDEFHPNRRIAILQNLTWLTQPGEVPADLVAIYGDGWSAKLIFGSAYLAAIDWNASDKNPDSCLLPVGQRFNDLLIEMGEDPVSDFSE